MIFQPAYVLHEQGSIRVRRWCEPGLGFALNGALDEFAGTEAQDELFALGRPRCAGHARLRHGCDPTTRAHIQEMT